MIFDSLLVAPVLEPGVKEWTVYLPGSGRWFEYKTLKEIKRKEVHVPLVKLGDVPAYIRGGKIIAVRRKMRPTSELMLRDPFELIVALDEKGQAEGRVYIDDGHSFAYENGGFLYRQFLFDNGVLTAETFLEGDYEKSFVKGYQNMVVKIVIVGLKRPPKGARDQNGKVIKMVVHGELVLLRKTRLPMKEDWKIVLRF
jgi:alpha 1,3-glucosidase